MYKYLYIFCCKVETNAHGSLENIADNQDDSHGHRENIMLRYRQARDNNDC